MKTLIPVLALLSASAAQAAPLTIWSCHNDELYVTVTMKIAGTPQPQGSKYETTLTVRDVASNEILTRMPVRQEMMVQQIGSGIEAAYVGGNAALSARFVISSKRATNSGYVSKLVFNYQGNKTTRTVSCLKARGMQPVFPM